VWDIHQQKQKILADDNTWESTKAHMKQKLFLPTRTLAAGLSTPIAFRIVAPSFVT